MALSNEKIREILDSAPEGATHYLTLSDTYLDNKNEVINIALLVENENLRQRVEELEQAIAVTESQRPHWAKGYTSDSVAAQTSHDALTAIWRLLGVENQTQAIIQISGMVEELEAQQSEVAARAVENAADIIKLTRYHCGGYELTERKVREYAKQLRKGEGDE